jgi:hypothetical protein
MIILGLFNWPEGALRSNCLVCFTKLGIVCFMPLDSYESVKALKRCCAQL